MGFARRAFHGALGGLGGTIVLTGFREALARVGAVGTSAPQQVVSRLEELGLVDDWSPWARRTLIAVAHLSYGVGVGTVMGLLRLGDEVVLEVTELVARCITTILSQAGLAKDPKIMNITYRHNANKVGVYARVLEGGRLVCGDRVVLV